MSKWILVGAFLAGLSAACGGGSGSGVSGSKKVIALSESEATDLCNYIIDVNGPARTIDCGGGLSLEVEAQTLAECTADLQALKTEDPTCAATVDNAETCAEDVADLTDAQRCSLSIPASCQPVFACGA